MECIFKKKRNPEKCAQTLPFPNIFQGVILLNKSSTSAWLEIILLANTKQQFPLFYTLLFSNPQTFRSKKPLRSGQTNMDFHLRNDADPSLFGSANRRPPEETNAHNLFLRKIMRSHNSCDNCVNERAPKRKNANSEKIQNFLLQIRFPIGYLFWRTIR